MILIWKKEEEEGLVTRADEIYLCIIMVIRVSYNV
jgi:hypothetical protein